MKIAVLGSKEYPAGSGAEWDSLGSGGFETFTSNLSKNFAALGAKVVVLTRKFPDQPKHETLDGVEVHRVSWISGFFLRTPSFNFLSFFKLLKLDYDVAIASGIFAPLVAELARLFNKKPVIVRPAGFGFRQAQYASFIQSALKFLQSTACFNADAVVFLSDEEKKNFLAYFGRLPKNHVVIKTGVSTPSFDLKRIARIKREYGGINSKRFVFLGRLIETKGVDFLLDAFAKTVGKNVLLVLGEGPLKGKLEARVSSDSKLKGRVFFLGYQNNPSDFIKASDVFVLPSLSEGLPIALLEAMACGVPCVVTDIGLPVENGKTALVVPPSDSIALQRAMERLLKDGKLSKAIVKNGLEKVKRDFSWARASKEYLKLAEKVL